MTVPRTVAEVINKHVTLEVEGIDRMYLNVYQPKLQSDKQVASFFRFHRGQPFASSALMELPSTGTLEMRLMNGGSDGLAVTGAASVAGTLRLTALEPLVGPQDWLIIGAGANDGSDFTTKIWPDGDAWIGAMGAAGYTVSK